MTRQRFLLFPALALALVLPSLAAEPAVEFIQFTDTHVTVLEGVKPELIEARKQFAGAGKALAAFFADDARPWQPNFFLFTGDLTDIYATAGADGAMRYGHIEAFMRAIAGSPAPVYLALGNHDIQQYHGWPDRKLDWDQLTAGEARAAWIAAAPCFRGGTYYAFDRRVGRTVYRFAVLDNGYPRLGPEQLDWLRKEAERQGSRVMVVAMHIPLGADERSRGVLNALAPARVALVVAGHNHRNGVEELPLPRGAAVQVRTAAFGYGADNWRRFRLLEDRIEVYTTAAPDKLEKTITVRAAE
jgi:3',5'-cyclic AMP phosphodiesterase CpdA